MFWNLTGLPAPATFDRFGQEDECTKSDLDGEQICLCGAGRKISEVSAAYNSGKKDRKYLFKCTDIPGNVGGFSGDTWHVNLHSNTVHFSSITTSFKWSHAMCTF